MIYLLPSWSGFLKKYLVGQGSWKREWSFLSLPTPTIPQLLPVLLVIMPIRTYKTFYLSTLSPPTPQ